MKSKDITNLINEIYEGVEKSVVGKIAETKKEDGSQTVNTLAYQTFLALINSLTPKNVVGSMEVTEPKEDWKGRE